MPHGIAFGRGLAALALGVALLATGTATSAASSKPAGDLVPAGAKVLTFESSPTGSPSIEVVTKLSVIDHVRALINSLPLSPTGPRICPDDLMIPSTVSFSVSRSAKPFTKVLFQLGGCPYAQVYQHGVAVTPTLGGSRISSVYATIKKLVG